MFSEIKSRRYKIALKPMLQIVTGTFDGLVHISRRPIIEGRNVFSREANFPSVNKRLSFIPS